VVVSIAYVVSRVALGLIWIICEACLFVAAFIRKGVFLNKPNESSVNRRDLMIYRLTLACSYLLSMYAGFIGGLALDKAFATPYVHLVSCIVPLATKKIIDKIYCKLLRTVGTFQIKRWEMRVMDRISMLGSIITAIVFVLNGFLLTMFRETE
jgi:hypothetical protein